MIHIDSGETYLNTVMMTKVAPVTSCVSPWLAPVIYALGCYVVIPSYFGQVKVTGQENIPRSGPVILAPTHRARWDAIIVPAMTGRNATGRDLRFMVSSNEMKGLQGWFIRRLGGFPVDTQHPTAGTLRHGFELLKAGEMLVIFPEGNIFRDGQVHPLKPGLARLALSAESSQPGLGVKIVPIGIRYSQPLPYWGCKVNMHIGSPLNVATYAKDSVKQGAKQLTSDLEVVLKELSGESGLGT